MEFRQSEEQGKDQFSDTREVEDESEEEEDEENKQVNNIKATNNCINATTRSNNSSSSSSSSRHHNLWFSGPSSSAAKNWPDHAVLMDYLSLRTTAGTDEVAAEGEGGEREREHMFDKVVTPSDVGKLNRLVIPKQHAERYFPLDSASTEKGLLLNFEDRGGKSWRFRYSYWNSSQSYVMTKGWSRFVKEKKLDAGDIVSFHRCPRDPLRLFIDWRRRPHHFNHHFFHHHNNNISNNLMIPGPYHHHQHRCPGSGIGGGTAYALPPSSHPPLPRSHHEAGFLYTQPPHHHRDHQHNQYHPHSDYMMYHAPGEAVPAAAPKRLRLFGVNMEYGSPSREDNRDDRDRALLLHHQRQQQQQQQQVRLPNNNTISSSSGGFIIPPEFSNKGKSSSNSLSFDLDP